MNDLISRQAAINTIMGQPPEPHYPSWYAAQIEKLPAAQPATNCSEIPNGSDDTISRQMAIDALNTGLWGVEWDKALATAILKDLPSAQPDVPDTNVGDLISRQAAIAHAVPLNLFGREVMMVSVSALENLPSAQPEQRYTEEELRVFAHGISLSLLSKRSAQHWQYDKDTATEIEFLERLYDKVSADMKGEQNEP